MEPSYLWTEAGERRKERQVGGVVLSLRLCLVKPVKEEMSMGRERDRLAEAPLSVWLRRVEAGWMGRSEQARAVMSWAVCFPDYEWDPTQSTCYSSPNSGAGRLP